MDEARRITDVEDVPDDGTLLVTLRNDEGDQREAILSELSDGTVVAWLNYCQHWTDVRLDTGDGAPMRGGEITCKRHAATFDRETGYCTYGPCEGAYLNEVETAVEDGGVYLTDDDYTFDSLGAAEAHTTSRSSTPTGGRIDF